LRTIAASCVAAFLVAGCGIGAIFAPAPDDLSTWQAVPLAPDAGLSAKAAQSPACRPALEQDVALEVILQDRRTSATAAFLVQGPTMVGSCYISPTGGGGGSQPAGQLELLDQPISIDEEGSGGADVGTLSYLGGRLGAEARQVVIEVPGGRKVTASVGNGHWLAWWPGGARAERVVASDEAGAQLFALTLGQDGWVAQ
jgi:hypothetical protein